MRIWVAGSLLALGLALLSGCGSDAGRPLAEQDCGGSVRFQGRVYVTNSGVNGAQSLGRDVGTGALVDCDHRTVVDRVTVTALTEVDTRQAIGVRRGPWHGVYVAEDLPRSNWPAVLSAR
jgi:hypothetical protein